MAEEKEYFCYVADKSDIKRLEEQAKRLDRLCNMAEQKEKKYSGYGYHGGGRKAKGEEPKTTTMSIVCTASERAFIREQAKNCGLSISGFVLAAINYFYERELKH